MVVVVAASTSAALVRASRRRCLGPSRVLLLSSFDTEGRVTATPCRWCYLLRQASWGVVLGMLLLGGYHNGEGTQQSETARAR
jgi:hypothetical protein